MSTLMQLSPAVMYSCLRLLVLTAVLPLLQLNFDENFEDGTRPDKMQEVPEWACA